ncbi:hypothetical protein, unlikely [Trypanosoma brucei gambiense DAL972]|uniref:Uncharacterized protein n=1 Tax=Trypanosoma brucei gambiense (strain MHOM/CI/86/DAL972) TaxID=679716 RepID=C9ZLD1_TRYB9|nr:hypothetical protein, unlikely [Trypanosoma brucei gambiense DAL972]CBH10140.1 hypothetical protein, unlikely [Trypanosoma brucei gambiense DAL972]|eukprot:XP_011772430.1 hypothetical protein, unlikely [Trypanosoma brucei gambiense DAL972]
MRNFFLCLNDAGAKFEQVRQRLMRDVTLSFEGPFSFRYQCAKNETYAETPPRANLFSRRQLLGRRQRQLSKGLKPDASGTKTGTDAARSDADPSDSDPSIVKEHKSKI